MNRASSRPQAGAAPLRFRGRSLRTQLVLWTTLLLAATTAGFGGTLLWRVRQATYQEVDADLFGAAQLLSERLAKEGLDAPWEIPELYRRRFGPGPRDHAYFVVWNAAGEVVHRSEDAPPEAAPEAKPLPDHGPRVFHSRFDGDRREVVAAGPHGAQLLVGRPVRKEVDRLVDLARWTAAAGAAVVAAGAFGAARLARGVLGPIETIAGAAERISAAHLSERIPAVQQSAELARLADVLNAAFDRLEASFARQARFTADAGHELRTPLSVVYASAELALARERTPEEYRVALEAVLRAARRMRGLVQSLLTLARLDAGAAEAPPERLRLDLLAADALALLRPLAEEKKIALHGDFHPAEVVGAPRTLEAAAVNLIQNAIHHNRPGGRVDVSTRTAEGAARLVVRDDGVGISASDLPRLFERFFRADPARSAAAGGCGLGLAVAQESAHALGGRIEVESVLEKGSTFTLILPSALPPSVER